MESTHEALWRDKKNLNEKFDTYYLRLLLTVSSLVISGLTMVIYCTRSGPGSSNPSESCCHSNYRFIRGCYLYYPDFLSQDIWFRLGLYSATSS